MGQPGVGVEMFGQILPLAAPVMSATLPSMRPAMLNVPPQ
jgi:hypothetical protein